MNYAKPISQALQKADCDIVKTAYIDANTYKKVIRKQREDNTFRNLWGKIAALADSVDVVIEKPRTARRMAHRSTPGEINATAMQYFKVNLFFPFIDHYLMQLDLCFPADKTGMFLASKLMPLTIATMTPAEIVRVFDWYSAYLPQNATFQQEIHCWTFCQDLKDKPSSVSHAFISADPYYRYYPNIHEIFHILLLTMPIGSIPCERSFSALRCLMQWNRTTMAEDRLNGLALLHIHRDVNVDRVKILDKFNMGNRRIGTLHL